MQFVNYVIDLWYYGWLFWISRSLSLLEHAVFVSWQLIVIVCWELITDLIDPHFNNWAPLLLVSAAAVVNEVIITSFVFLGAKRGAIVHFRRNSRLFGVVSFLEGIALDLYTLKNLGVYLTYGGSVRWAVHTLPIMAYVFKILLFLLQLKLGSGWVQVTIITSITHFHLQWPWQVKVIQPLPFVHHLNSLVGIIALKWSAWEGLVLVKLFISALRFIKELFLLIDLIYKLLTVLRMAGEVLRAYFGFTVLLKNGRGIKVLSCRCVRISTWGMGLVSQILLPVILSRLEVVHVVYKTWTVFKVHFLLLLVALVRLYVYLYLWNISIWLIIRFLSILRCSFWCNLSILK